MAFGVTTIKSMSNYASSNVEVTNTQSGQIVIIPPSGTVPSNVEIPWADDWNTAFTKHLTIEVGNTPRYYIFQKQGIVYYLTNLTIEDWQRRRTRAPGHDERDGDRVLVIKSDETFEIQIG